MKIHLVSLCVIFILSGCASTPESMVEDKPIIDGRPTKAQCVERQDRAFEIQDWMRDYPKDIEAIGAVRNEIETVLFNDGCTWLYGTSERLEGHHLARVKILEDLLRDYIYVLEEKYEQQGMMNNQQEFLKEVLTGKISIDQQEQVLEKIGGRVIKQNGAYIAQPAAIDLY